MSLEKAAADLKAFKQLASCSISALERVRCPLKRLKCTSSDVGVSPDTARERPRSKLSRKILEFNSKVQMLHKEDIMQEYFLGRPFYKWCLSVKQQ